MIPKGRAVPQGGGGNVPPAAGFGDRAAGAYSGLVCALCGVRGGIQPSGGAGSVAAR